MATPTGSSTWPRRRPSLSDAARHPILRTRFLLTSEPVPPPIPHDPTAHGLLTRREMLAALASIAALPLVSACGAARTSPAAAPTDADRNAIMLLDRIGNDLLHLFPEWATSLGLDVGTRAELR